MAVHLALAAVAASLLAGQPIGLEPAGYGGITIIPDPIAIQLGPIPIAWYGLCYALGLAGVYVVLVWRAPKYGQDPVHAGTGLLIVGIAALVGGRIYHLIDQWQIYQGVDVWWLFLPIRPDPNGTVDLLGQRFTWGISGLGVYGGIISGTIAAWLYLRWKHLSFAVWADIAAPAIFVMQAIGRWGNFFNQELYGPPTDLPWGIAIECAHRTSAYPCTEFPFETTFFQPLFLYESLSGLLGFLALVWIGRRFRSWLRPGDLFLIFLIWYSVVRFALETLRTDNWTFFGVPTAMVVSALTILVALAIMAIRHSRPRAPGPYPADVVAATEAADEDAEDWEPAPDEVGPDEDDDWEAAPEEIGPEPDDRAPEPDDAAPDAGAEAPEPPATA